MFLVFIITIFFFFQYFPVFYRKDFLAYLRRPDHKQEFVAQFQKVSTALSKSIGERYTFK